MKLTLIPNPIPTWHTLVETWQSENGKWFVHLEQLIFTRRVIIRNSAEPQGVILSYCGGANPIWQVATLNTVKRALELLPEDVTVREVMKIFPEQKYKPMGNDPDCWTSLVLLSGLDKQIASDSLRLFNEELGGVNGKGEVDDGKEFIPS